MENIGVLKKEVLALKKENQKLKNFVDKVRGSTKGFKNRAKGQSEWLKGEYPHIFKDQKHSEPSIYDGHTFGEHWMD